MTKPSALFEGRGSQLVNPTPSGDVRLITSSHLHGTCLDTTGGGFWPGLTLVVSCGREAKVVTSPPRAPHAEGANLALPSKEQGATVVRRRLTMDSTRTEAPGARAPLHFAPTFRLVRQLHHLARSFTHCCRAWKGAPAPGRGRPCLARMNRTRPRHAGYTSQLSLSALRPTTLSTLWTNGPAESLRE